LTQDEASGQLQITYLDEWQWDGYAISTGLPLDNQHTLIAAYNYLDN
jgi:serine/threonine-protein kinase HipA